MSKFVSNIPKMIARIVLVAAVAIATIGGAAYADETVAQRHEQEMNKGKDHAAAREATSGAQTAVDSPAAFARAKVHEDEMAKGKDHAAAWLASTRAMKAPGYSPRLVAKTKQHLDAMNSGKDHYAAWDATRASE